MPRHEFLCEKCQKPFELTMSTGRGELRRRGHVESFRATEIPDNEKPRVIEAYLSRWSYQVKGYFKALPNPADHPVFRIARRALI